MPCGEHGGDVKYGIEVVGGKDGTHGCLVANVGEGTGERRMPGGSGTRSTLTTWARSASSLFLRIPPKKPAPPVTRYFAILASVRSLLERA